MFTAKDIEINNRRTQCLEFQNRVRESLKKALATRFSQIKILQNTEDHAQVSLAWSHENDQLVIVKEYFHSQEWLLNDYCHREIECLLKVLRLHSSHFQTLINIDILKNSTKLILEYYPVPFNVVIQPSTPTFLAGMKARELITMVRSLHALGIAHRDLKSTNLRFDARGVLVMIDFDSGLLTDVSNTHPVCTITTRAPELLILEKEYLHRKELRKAEKKEQVEHKQNVQCKKNEHNKENIMNDSGGSISSQNEKEPDYTYNAFACDWWSVGCVIAEMFLGEPLFTYDEIRWQKLDNVLADVLAFCDDLHSHTGHKVLVARTPPLWYNILKLLLREDPEQRLKNVVCL